MAGSSTAGLLTTARPSLRLGDHVVDPPVVLAPMAGITNGAFRTLCREQGAGLFVSEMVTARALVERSPETLRMITPAPGETPRSVQLYTVGAEVVAQAVTMLGNEGLADHIDLNFGCPVPKVTRKGGGAALPYKRRLFQSIVTAAVRAAEPFGMPVTVKMRKGIDDEHLTFLEAGRIAADAGVAWVALHGRTAAQLYGGQADWSAIAQLAEALAPFPVLGNGDIWSAADALRMMDQTGCAGVVVGRGCLGRPWLFAELAAAFAGEPIPAPPSLGEVASIFRRHAALLADHFEDEGRACRDIRKHVAWYLKGFSVRNEIRVGLAEVGSFAEMDELLGSLRDQPYPDAVAAIPRGRTSSGRAVALPEFWLDDPEALPIITADEAVSGG
jgi:nifR3 family TIM-barrel protein